MPKPHAIRLRAPRHSCRRASWRSWGRKVESPTSCSWWRTSSAPTSTARGMRCCCSHTSSTCRHPARCSSWPRCAAHLSTRLPFVCRLGSGRAAVGPACPAEHTAQADTPVHMVRLVLHQVVCDVARAIGAAFDRGVLHRDVTPNNIGHLEGRGYLLDFSAGKVCTTVLRGGSRGPGSVQK